MLILASAISPILTFAIDRSPHNERLYEFVQRDAQAPEEEPPFPQFPHPCVRNRASRVYDSK